ncbi:ribosome recycling factor [Candidatus Sumerlaeota bacterium]|nr:ribosome recycling factor [Candidatus Sumerlaeales bacterium]NLD61731.1 ribosome recycling factor [Candidatus Sumerlaeota bacterium]
MLLNNVYQSSEAKMQKALLAVEHDFTGLRTGRASTALVDGVQIEAYGTKMPLKQVATISTPDARTLAITPFDRGQIAIIEKAIISANLGMMPNNDGSMIRLSIPMLTEERRKDLVKMANKMAENGRISIRTVRRTAMEEVKKLQKASTITEDDMKKAEKKIQDMTDKWIKDIDARLAKKEKEIMEI